MQFIELNQLPDRWLKIFLVSIKPQITNDKNESPYTVPTDT